MSATVLERDDFDLEREAIQAEGDEADLVAALNQLKVATALINLGLVSGARVMFDGAYHQHHDDGQFALVVPVRTAPAPTGIRPWAWIVRGPIIDEIAIDPENPTHWTLATGTATWAGMVDIDGAGAVDDEMFPPVVIYPTPVDWLRSGCRPGGIVPLTTDPYTIRDLLLHFRAIAAPDQRHADALDAILDLPSRATPTVSIAKDTKYASPAA